MKSACTARAKSDARYAKVIKSSCLMLCQKLVSVRPDNKEAFYTVLHAGRDCLGAELRADRGGSAEAGDEARGTRSDQERRSADRLRGSICRSSRKGIGNLDKALALDAEYDDAMAYINLLYRAKADLEDSPESYRDDIAQADAWFQKVIDIRKAKASRKP